MLANNNLKVCRTLVTRDFKFHPVKNTILILSAMLVTALYTFVFLLGSSVEEGFLLNYEYTYGSTSHILYTGLTDRQADTIAGNANVKSTVRLSTVGQVTDPMIGQRVVKLAVTDRDYAKSVLSVPTTGKLPTQPGEIALDEFTMDSLGVLREIGAPVTIQWTDPDGNTHTSQFSLCGWWLSSTNFTEACAWITEETAQTLFPGYDDAAAANVTLGVNLYQPKELDVQAEEILAEQGVAGVNFTTNLAYNDAKREQASGQARPFYQPALLVLLCGYLMVYSIIHVAARRDLMYYAGLKSLGLTPRQLRRILLEQGCIVSAAGFLPGWLLGFGIHFCITSRVITGMEENPALYFLTWQPFAVAALCTLATTLLAYLLPTMRLSRMTPAQTILSATGRLPKHGRSSDGRTTLSRLALRSLGRSRWRTILSAISLLLAVVLLSGSWIIYSSIKQDLYLSVMSPWDYSLADGSAYLSVQRYNEANQGITEQTVDEIRTRPEVTEVSSLKSHEIALIASDELRQRIVDYYNQPYDETMTLRESQSGFPDWCAGVDRLEQTGEYTGLVIGLDGAYLNYVLTNSPFTSGEFDAEAFASGEYVLAAGAYHDGISTPAAGETVELGGRTFKILGSVMHDDSYLSGSNSTEAAFSIAYLMPPETFEELFPGQSYRQLAVDIDPSMQDSFEEYLDQFEQGINRGVGIIRRSEYAANFESARLNEVLPTLVVALVLLGIALINFVNMLVVKTVSRRNEFAVYESLGMTQSQLRHLMMLEGVFHAVLMAVVLVPVTVLFAWFVMPSVVDAMGSWCAVYTFSILPLWLVLPVILLLAIIVPLACLRFITRGSITQRMRRVE